MKKVVRKEVLRWLDERVIYPIFDSSCGTPAPFYNNLIVPLIKQNMHSLINRYSDFTNVQTKIEAKIWIFSLSWVFSL